MGTTTPTSLPDDTPVVVPADQPAATPAVRAVDDLKSLESDIPTLDQPTQPYSDTPAYKKYKDRKKLKRRVGNAVIALACISLFVACAFTYMYRKPEQSRVQAGTFDTVKIKLPTIPELTAETQASSLKVNGQIQAENTIVLSPTDKPSKPVAGQLYFDKALKTLQYYTGTAFTSVGNTINTTIHNLFTSSSTTNTTIIGSSDSTPTPSVILQPTSPGIQQSGNLNISGSANIGATSISQSSGGSVISLFENGPIPGNPSDDAQSVNVGVKFKSDRAGVITGIKYFSPAGNNAAGTDIGQLWACAVADCVPASGGTQLASVSFPSDTTAGWKQAMFSTPVTITPNTYYVASYWSEQGMYYAKTRYFTASHDNLPLHAPASNATAGNGLFVYNSSGFPNGSFQETNYWVDVVFQPTDTRTSVNSTDPLNLTSTGGSLSIGTDAEPTVIQGSSITLLSAKSATLGIGMSATGTGADLTIHAGRGLFGGNNNGGNLYLQGGPAGGTADGGKVIVKSPTDVAGAFQIQTSTASVLFGVDTLAYEIAVIGTNARFAQFALINSHIVTAQNNPPTIGTPANCGTLPAAAITAGSTDSAGSFTITTGTGGTSSTCDVTFTFEKPYATSPKSIMIGGKSNVASVSRQIYVTSTTTTSFTVSFAVSAGGANSATYSFNYWVVN